MRLGRSRARLAPRRLREARAALADALTPRARPEPGIGRDGLLLGLEYALFSVGLAFVSQQTVLPAFAAHLGAPNVVIGAIPGIMTLGWLLPSVFVAGHTQSLGRKLPFILRYTVWERAPFLVLALVALFVAIPAPRLALALTLGLLLVATTVGGTLIPAWMDVVGRLIPTTLRGRFFAGANLVGSLGGLLASLATAYLLGRLTPPGSFGVCFLAGTGCIAIAYLVMARIREPADGQAAPPVPLGAYLRSLPGLVRADRDLSRYLAARAVGILGAMAPAFYTVFALRAHGAVDWHVGLFTALLLAGQVVGTPVLGWLADRAGHRAALLVGMAAAVLGNALAVAAPALTLFSVAFVLTGIHMAAINISARTVLLEFAPTIAERPIYVGLGNTALAPVSLGGPILAGILSDALGFRFTFATAAGLGVVGLGLLAGVRDPRRRADGSASRP